MSSTPSSRSRQWRIHLQVLQPEVSPAEEQSQLQQLRAKYKALVEKHPFPIEEEENSDDHGKARQSTLSNDIAENDSNSGSSSLDPLTAMMMEEQSKQEHLEKMDLAYRKERAKRNRGSAVQRIVESEEYDETAVTLQIIDKDLQRLPVQHQTCQERVACLRQVLFVFHCVTHPHPGYRQGQHEIASYLLHALEQDQVPNGTTANLTENQYNNDLAADTYTILLAILDPIQAAYDSGRDEKQPLVSLGRRILQLTAQYHPTLMRELQQKVQVPPQLYLTKWIRLLYSRELSVVASDDKNRSEGLTEAVLGLWDFLFRAASLSSGSSASTAATSHPLLAVLEAAAAARLLLHAHIILQSEDPLHYLMNMPPQDEASLGPWQTVTLEILQHKTPPLSHVQLTVPPAAATTAPQQPQPHPSDPANMTDPAGTGSFWNTSLSKLTLSSVSATGDPLSGGSSNPADPSGSNRPLLNSLSAGFKQTLEQAKSTTQSISKRISHEWEQALQQQQYSQHYQSQQQQRQSFTQHSGLQPPSAATTTSAFQPASSSYNVLYRDKDAMYDPPVVVSPPPQPHADGRNLDDDWQQSLVTQATIVQSFLTHLEQDKGVDIPPHVWQAMGELQALAGQGSGGVNGGGAL